MVAFATERDLAARVVSWFEELGYEVFQEVQIREGGPRADIVARRARVIYVVETKQHMGLGVLEQASSWLGEANKVSIAVPAPGPRGVTPARFSLLNRLGIGLLGVTAVDVVEMVPPRPFRRGPTGTLEDYLTQDLKDWTHSAAGTNRGGHMTPFARTAESVRTYVGEHPDGLSVTELVAGIRHHYMQADFAAQRLRILIKKGAIRGVRSRGQGQLFRVYPNVDEGAVS